MAFKRISDYTASGALAGTEQLEIETAAGVSLKATAQQIADLAGSPARAVTALAIAAGVVNIDLALGRDFTLALTANVTSLTFTNLAGAGLASEYELLITQDGTGSRTFALPASHKALGGSDTAIASAANAITLLSAKTFDNGTTWRYAMQESA